MLLQKRVLFLVLLVSLIPHSLPGSAQSWWCAPSQCLVPHRVDILDPSQHPLHAQGPGALDLMPNLSGTRVPWVLGRGHQP